MEILSTSSINELVYNYKSVEINRRLSSVQTKKKKFSSLSSTLSEVSTKVTSLISSLSKLKSTSSSSIFNAKAATSSNQNFVTANVENTASKGSYEVFVQQLAKNDMSISQDLNSSTIVGTSGTHTFTVKTGDGDNADYTSTVSVELDGTETNLSLLEKIADAVNTDYAEVSSSSKTAAGSYSGGASTLKIDVGGTEYSISVNGGSSYEDLIDELVSQINTNAEGISAEKVLDDPVAGDVKLKLTALNTDDYISISHESGFDLTTDLGIAVTKEISASTQLTASSFTPSSSKAQLSFASRQTGLDYRIKSISDDTGSSVLSQLGLNLGTSRPAFDQSGDPDTAGFVYADITDSGNDLNSKFTFNTIQIQKNSNSVTDLVTGVTLNLKSLMTASDSNVNIIVEQDIETISSEIQDFIDKYNSLYSFLKEKTKSTEDSRGVLRGDATINSLLNTLKSIGYSAFGDSADNFQYLSQLGVTFNSETGLSISDSELFDEKIKYNSANIQKMFNSSNGIGTLFYDSLSSYTGVEGYISYAINSYNDSVEYFSDKIDSITKSIDKSAEVLRKRYQALQIQYATILSTQSLFTLS